MFNSRTLWEVEIMVIQGGSQLFMPKSRFYYAATSVEEAAAMHGEAYPTTHVIAYRELGTVWTNLGSRDNG